MKPLTYGQNQVLQNMQELGSATARDLSQHTGRTEESCRKSMVVLLKARLLRRKQIKRVRARTSEVSTNSRLAHRSRTQNTNFIDLYIITDSGSVYGHE